jgi:pilus assembly protein Flp/PilA
LIDHSQKSGQKTRISVFFRVQSSTAEGNGLIRKAIKRERKNQGRPTLIATVRRGLGMMFNSANKGQGLVEYAMILMLVAIVVIVILAIMGPAIGNMFSNVVHNI